MLFLQRLVTWVFILGFFGLVAFLGVMFFFGSGLKDYRQLKDYEPPVTSRLYANDGRMFAEYAFEKRLFVPLNAIPERVRQAFLAAEDKNFYEHGGLNFISILRAAMKNVVLISQGRRPIGASTISQQVAKNFLLNEISTQVSMGRKIKEAILTFRIESAFTKDHILELYLNEIFLGMGSYGVAAAALNYFNKSLEDLSIAEVAFLAALPKAPVRYHPVRYPERAKDRRNWVIKQMLAAGFITDKEAQSALQEPLVLHKRQANNIVEAPYFAEEIRRELVSLFGEQVLYKGGLAVRTTLDPNWQTYADLALKEGLVTYDRNHGWRGPLQNIGAELTEKALSGWQNVMREHVQHEDLDGWHVALVLSVLPEKAVIGLRNGQQGVIPLKSVKWARKFVSNDLRGPEITKVQDVLQIGDVIYVSPSGEHKGEFNLQQLPKVSGAIVVMEPHTGRVLAMRGGFSFKISQFNRATQAKRQVGSTLKPFIYLKALENGLTPATIIEDSPLAIDLGGSQGIWTPHNYSKKFYGQVTIRKALEQSLNLAPVRLVYENVKLTGLAEITERFGIYERMPLHYSNTLGAAEVTLMKLTSAYAMIVNGGYRIHPTLIDRVQDRRGHSIVTSNLRSCENCSEQMEWFHQEPPKLIDNRKSIINPIHAYQIVSMLQGAVQRGTSRSSQVNGMIFGGKTGTSNDFHDAWFIGMTPDLIVGIYIGFDGSTSLGSHQGGSRVAAPIFKNFATMAQKYLPTIPFRIPSGVTFAKIDYNTGLPPTAESKTVIHEAFMPGTVPSLNQADTELKSQPHEIAAGTGGLY